MDRRRFLKAVAGIGLPFLFSAKQAAAAAAPAPVRIPLSRLSAPWSFVEFNFTKNIKTHRGLQPSAFPGYLIRLPREVAGGAEMKEGLYAVSRICPHEGCPINFYRQRVDVPYPLQVESFPNPMLVCTCHQSLFDPAQKGRVLGGPAPRPPWVFEFAVEKKTVVIEDLEPGGEKWG